MMGPEITLYGRAGNPKEARWLMIDCCDDPTPATGTRHEDGSYDLYCESCDRTYAQLIPLNEGW